MNETDSQGIKGIKDKNVESFHPLRIHPICTQSEKVYIAINNCFIGVREAAKDVLNKFFDGWD